MNILMLHFVTTNNVLLRVGLIVDPVLSASFLPLGIRLSRCVLSFHFGL